VSSTRPPRAARALAKRQEERTPADGLSIEGVFYPIGMDSVGLPDWQAFAVDNSTYFPPTPLRESPNIIAGLQRIAPVIAIRGNVDTGRWAEYYPETQMITLGGRCIYVLHDIKALRLEPASSGVDVILCGHPHRPRIEIIRGVLYLNPGSAGPRRFNLPIAVETLDLTTGGLTPVIHHLGGAS
jgi:putative phosphoesterase